MRFYRMTETAWAQIQAVGISLQVGGSIWGLAPESWFGSSRGLEKRSLWPSCLAIKIMAADYNGGVRTAFGVSLGSVRLSLKTVGRGMDDRHGEAGWDFWCRRPS